MKIVYESLEIIGAVMVIICFIIGAIVLVSEVVWRWVITPFVKHCQGWKMFWWYIYNYYRIKEEFKTRSHHYKQVRVDGEIVGESNETGEYGD